jgi:CPA1 family monovalent cation:H+ antiporter
MPQEAVGIESLVIGIMVVAVFVAATARRFRMPYTIAMVLTGLAVSLVRLPTELSDLRLSPHLILVTFLPGLIFEAAYHLDLTQLRDNIRTIVMLAVPGMILSTLIIGWLLHMLLPLGVTEAMLFGILISATDPIAVIGLFKELGVERRLGILVEGESLFNDGAAIVLYSILLGVATGQETFSLGQTTITFFVTVAGGVALGLIVGLIFSELMKRTEDHVLDIALTAIVAYGTYLFAEEALHGAVSPVIAVVVAAVYVGNYGSQGSYSGSSQVTIISFWEFTAFLINSAIFLLIGIEIDPVAFIEYARPVAIAIGAVLVARVIVIFTMRYIVNRSIRRFPVSWGYVLIWGGLRGAVSIALVLSLPFTLGSRELLEIMAFGYVLFSLIVQGLTIRPLLNRLGITKVSEKRKDFERKRAGIAMSQAAISALDQLYQDNILSGPVCTQLRGMFEDQIDDQWGELERMIAQDPSLVEQNVELVQRQIINRQKRALRRLLQRGILSEDVFEDLSAELDEHELHTRQGDWRPRSVLVRGPEAYLPRRPDEEGLSPEEEEAQVRRILSSAYQGDEPAAEPEA